MAMHETMDSAPPRFCYERALGEDELRILIIKPSKDFDSDILCDLNTLRREECGKYTALSYWWGPKDEKNARIMIGNSVLEVRHSLATALRYLRGENEARVFWIDAVCINQGDEEEKTLQVRQMMKTYENSAKVIVWLGAPSEEESTTAGIRAIDELGSQLTDSALKDIPAAKIDPPAHICGCEPKDYALAIFKLLQRPWFTRLWVIQEICLAPEDVILMCGYDVVAFWKLTHLQLHPIYTQPGIVPEVQIPQDGGDRHKMLARAQEAPIGLTRQFFVAARKNIAVPMKTKWTLLSHLWNFRNRDCTDPRDRVYSLLGISRDEWILPPDPDYTKSMSEAYTAATKAIIETHNRLDVMGMCHAPIEDRKLGEGLGSGQYREVAEGNLRPSWAPDFNLSPTLRPTSSLTVYGDMKPYYTATEASVARPTFPAGTLEMTVKGYCIGEVADLGFDNDTARDWQGTLRRSRGLVGRLTEKMNSPYKDIDDAFWRTLITDRTGHRTPASSDIEGREFKLWWNHIFSDPRTRSLETEKSYIQYQSAWIQHFHFRNFFTTHSGYMGLCPLPTIVGDAIFLLPGSQVPFVLRRLGDKYQVIGECYVHGIMDGSLWRDLDLNRRGERVEVRLF